MKHTAVVGLGWGDEGKGTTVDWLTSTRPVTAVVLFNSGPQAAHNVVMADGRHHTFRQFGSGAFRGVPTVLSRFKTVDPIGFMREAEHLSALGVRWPAIEPVVDGECLLTTPWHMAVNRARELRRTDRHGTCGVGHGETIRYAQASPWGAPRVKDILNPFVLLGKLSNLAEWATAAGCSPLPSLSYVMDKYQQWVRAVTVQTSEAISRIIERGNCVFEGAQGVLLDEWHGFHPHTTWSTTTYDNISELVSDPDDVERLGVVRAYSTRHGEGPFPTENPVLPELLPEHHNDSGGPQGAFRVGVFDAMAHGYAVDVCGRVDSLVVTHLDSVEKAHLALMCTGYMGAEAWFNPTVGEKGDLRHAAAMTREMFKVSPFYEPVGPGRWLAEIEHHVGVPVGLTSWGPTAEDKRVVTTVSA